MEGLSGQSFIPTNLGHVDEEMIPPTREGVSQTCENRYYKTVQMAQNSSIRYPDIPVLQSLIPCMEQNVLVGDGSSNDCSNNGRCPQCSYEQRGQALNEDISDH
ncbi:hypothetical protein TNCV_2866781 [Trichonephila clavipes]|nr:hypothetical protein TNCV_2866781 [Trichonephila clavipes]